MKKIILLLILTLSIILSGCSNKEDSAMAYLKEKYGEKFNYVGLGDTVWSSKSKFFIFTDDSGNEFTVEERGGSYSDDYGSIIYDREIQQKLSSVVPAESKLFASTEGCRRTYTNKDMSVEEYMKEAGIINVVILTTESDNYKILTDSLIEFSSDLVISGVIYQVSDEMFNEVNSFTESQENTHDIIACESFWIENNELD